MHENVPKRTKFLIEKCRYCFFGISKFFTLVKTLVHVPMPLKSWRHLIEASYASLTPCMSHKWMSNVAYEYRVVPGSRNWQVETADWNLDVRLDI